MSASDKSGSRERIAVGSIKRVKNSSLQISVKKIIIKFSLQIYPNCIHSPTKHKIN